MDSLRRNSVNGVKKHILSFYLERVKILFTYFLGTEFSSICQIYFAGKKKKQFKRIHCYKEFLFSNLAFN